MRTILVIDDEVAVRSVLQDILHDEGYRVLLADHAEEGLAYLRTVLVELVVSDVMLPGMTGVELCAVLAANRRFAGIPLMLMSAAQMPGDLPTPPYAGFLRKPFHLDELLQRIDDAVAAPQARRG